MRGGAIGRYGLLAFMTLWVPWMAPILAHGADIVVSSATPAAAPQGTVALTVTIKGGNFPKKALVRFCRTDTGSATCDPDKITVTNAVGKGTSTIEATIDIALDASTTNFDIEVIETLSGRKGRGTGLFSVVAKSNAETEVPLGSFQPELAFIKYSTNDFELRVGRFSAGIWARVASAHRIMTPSWSPDGQRLLYVAVSGTKIKGSMVYSRRFMVRRLDGSSPEQLLSTEPSLATMSYPAAWTNPLADGKQYIIYSTDIAGSKELLARVIACSATACSLGEPIQLTAAESINTFRGPAVVSRDASHLVVRIWRPFSTDPAESETLTLHSLSLDEAGVITLSNPHVILAPRLLGVADVYPRFSAALPDQVVYLLYGQPSAVETIRFDAQNQPIARSVLRYMPPNASVGGGRVEINNTGTIGYRGNIGGGADRMYMVAPGGADTEIPYTNSENLSEPILRP